MSQALADIIIERSQHPFKGYTERHDDEHSSSELAKAAAAYALANTGSAALFHLAQSTWPWDEEDFKPRSHRENLVRSAALIIAEIERLDRVTSGS